MKLRRRQVHLDFHTSPLIPDVGRAFDADEFADTLADACVDSVTCFAKCHHGMLYYDSNIGPRHPSLTFDLLGAMIEACHVRDILVPAYISVQFDEHAARSHPEWRLILPDGSTPGPIVGDAPNVGWPTLCWLTGYRSYLVANVIELLKKHDVDGLFFDICLDQESCTEPALRMMRDAGIDTADPVERKRFGHEQAVRFCREFAGLVHQHRKGLPVFFNGRVGFNMRDSLPALTHLEVESLPTGGWGYDHFQRLGRYARTLGKPFLGMTSRFHKSWGDFGTLKSQAALEFEVLAPIAHGGGASIGDQLHPKGRLDRPVYERIRAVYGKVRDLEPWCADAKPVTQVGVVSATTNPALAEQEAIAIDRGATAILNETHQLFDLLDADASFTDFELIVLPDAIAPDEKLVMKIQTFVGQGGRLLLTGKSMLDEGIHRFVLKGLPVTYMSDLAYTPFYVRVKAALDRDLAGMDHCVYEAGVRVQATRRAEVLAHVVVPYFNRSAEHYCSHFQTPPARATRDPAIVLSDRVAYINAPLFKAYANHGYAAYRRMVAACLERLLPDRLLRTSLPASARVSVLEQKRPRERCYVLHLLHYPVTRRAGELEIVEHVVPLHDVAIELGVPDHVSSVECVPQREPVPFDQVGGHLRFIVPRINGHQAVCVTL